MITKTIVISMAALVTTSCVQASSKTIHYQIETGRQQQTIQHFGASDAWSMQFIGLWPETQQRQIADWLFSTQNDATGRPKGIGLSLWRFNLGAGSAEQGDTAQIHPGTRTECLLRPDGTYDWTRQAAQRHFLRLAKERGVPRLLAFMNSVPVQFTANGWATNTGRGGTMNIKPDCYDDVARFTATALKGIEEHDGVHIDYLSPVNEPDGSWNWLGPKQEGSPATNREVARLVREISRQLTKQKVNAEIIVNESSDLRCVLGIHQTDWQRGNELAAFFTKDSTATYLGNLAHVPHLLAAHSYWTNTPIDTMRAIRLRLREAMKRHSVKFWQSEICIMGNDKEIGGGTPYDFSMRTALYVARVIHHDLVYGNAESWSWWRAAGGDYRDGLIRVYSDDGMKTGWAADSKLMWALGNYSRFVRPGAVRYDVTATDAEGKTLREGDTDPYGLMCSAFKNVDGRWAVVVINYSQAAQSITLPLPGGTNTQWEAYRTSERSSESLAPIGTTGSDILLAPQSITTFVSR